MSDEVLDDLAAEDTERRRRAVQRSDSLPPERRRRAWLSGLGDLDWRVRREAIDAVASHAGGDAETIEALIDALLQGDNVGLRNAALEALGRLGRDASEALRRRLRRTQGGERKFLIEALGDAGAPEAVAELVALCSDADPNIAAASVDALARLGGAEAEQALRDRLKNSEPFLRMAALDGLVRLGARLAWSELAPLLDDPFARRVAVPLLGRSGAAEAVGPLARLLESASPHVSAQATRALYELASSLGLSVVETPLTAQRLVALRTHLREGDRATRRAALALALAGRDVEALGDVLAVAGEDTLPPLAVEALRRWGNAAIAPLLEVESRVAGPARALALELAAELGRDQAPDPTLRASLLRALAAPAPRVVAAAVRGLAWHARGEDLPRILGLANDERDAVRGAAREALDLLGERHPDALVQAVSHIPRAALGGVLPRVLARAGAAATLDELRTAFASGDAEQRAACLEALGELGGDAPVDLIALSLTDEDPWVRMAAATVLGRLGQGTDALLRALRAGDEDPEVRAAIVRSLGSVEGPEIDDALRGCLDDDAPLVVVSALHGLLARRHPAASVSLREVLRHGDEGVVGRTFRAIGTLPEEEAKAVAEALLDHENWSVRAHAARLLAGYGGAEATLVARLGAEEDERVRDAIRAALPKVRGG